MKKMSVVKAVFAAPFVGLLTMDVAQAALDVTGVQIALDAHFSTFETVGIALIAFILGSGLIYGVIALLRGRAR